MIAAGHEVVFNGAIEQLQGAVGVEGLRQSAFTLGGRQAVGRVVVAQAFADQVLVEAAYRREQASQAAR
ncbi:hypothetical protein D3C73_1455310 [compost metagenome]